MKIKNHKTIAAVLALTFVAPVVFAQIPPAFSPDRTRIEIQSAMLSADNRSMNICIVPVPESWLKRTYK